MGRPPLKNRKTKSYKIWLGMKTRCYNQKSINYHLYGGRGIKVCDLWLKFDNFYKDMGDPPTPQHSLDRIDHSGNYEKSNCKWSTPKEQSLNRRNNRRFFYNGEHEVLNYFSIKYGLNYNTLCTRCFRLKWPIEKAIEMPVKPKLKNL